MEIVYAGPADACHLLQVYDLAKKEPRLPGSKALRTTLAWYQTKGQLAVLESKAEALVGYCLFDLLAGFDPDLEVKAGFEMRSEPDATIASVRWAWLSPHLRGRGFTGPNLALVGAVRACSDATMAIWFRWRRPLPPAERSLLNVSFGRMMLRRS